MRSGLSVRLGEIINNDRIDDPIIKTRQDWSYGWYSMFPLMSLIHS